MGSEIKSLSPQLKERLSPEIFNLLREAGELAAGQGQSLYLVGGAVRDLLLGKESFDLDLVVEGDAPKLASLLAEREGGEVIAYRRFGTAKFRCGELSIDIATARGETYPHPGALPKVYPGSLKEDLFRRDFTINAMAINLCPQNFGELIDPYKGKEDLEKGLIRILHERSFIDDATRILRGIRYEQRFGFKLEQSTEQLLQRDLAMLKTISGDRIRHELELILKEECPGKVLQRAEGLGVLSYIYPPLKGDGWLKEKFREACLQTRPSLALYFSLLVYPFSLQEGKEFIEHLKIPGNISRVIRDTLCLKGSLEALTSPELLPSTIYNLLQGYSPLSILVNAIASDSPIICRRLELYLNKLRYVKTSLDGKALQRMGISPGPRLGEVLHILQEARLNGKVRTKEEEEELVRGWLDGTPSS